MAYIYKKIIGNKEYYYLRVSKKMRGKVITKDIAYLGGNIDEVSEKLKTIPSKYSEELRKGYRTINRFIYSNHFLEKARQSKLKKDDYLDKEAMDNVEACRLHWNTKFQKHDINSQKETLKNFIVDFAFNSTSIEGNTISLKQAQNLLLENKTPADKDLREIYDLQNTEKVFEELLADSSKELNHDFIIQIHDKLIENIDTRKGYRTDDVRVFRQNFKSTPAPYVKSDMELLLKWYKKNEDTLNPFVLAVIFHHKFEKIHPFMDGNGRSGRMLLNLILLKKKYPLLIIRRKNRVEYLRSMNSADKSKLTEANSTMYFDLVNFAATEMQETYWNIFL